MASSLGIICINVGLFAGFSFQHSSINLRSETIRNVSNYVYANAILPSRERKELWRNHVNLQSGNSLVYNVSLVVKNQLDIAHYIKCQLVMHAIAYRL